MTVLMVIQLLIVLLALWVGSRYGSLALGAISGIGLALLVFGGDALRSFAFVITVGVIIGTYSSIYVSVAILNLL